MTSFSLRVAHVGNITNKAYRQVKALRVKGVDAELFLPYVREVFEDPVSEDDNLKSGYPEWIRFWDNRYKSTRYPYGKISLVNALRSNYDVIHAYTELSIFAMLSMKPYVAEATGSDLRELAFTGSMKGILMKRAFLGTRVVIFEDIDLLHSVQALGIKNSVYLPIPVDADKFRPERVKELRSSLGFENIIFQPTGQRWKIKGNDKLIIAFAELLKNHKDILLILAEWGSDVDGAKELIRKLSISDNVLFVKPMVHSELVKYYNASDIVTDQFLIGSFGTVSLEAMSCGKPVITCLDKDILSSLGIENPPIMEAKTISEIYQMLRILVEDKKLRLETGRKSREWILKYHSLNVIGDKLINIYEKFI